jgi:plasmid stability protein
MVFHMKTTLEIDEGVMRALKRRAADEGRTMSELVEAALRALLEARPTATAPPPLPVWDSGRMLVDIDDRSAVEELLAADDADARR